jgi:hypothetical protein
MAVAEKKKHPRDFFYFIRKTFQRDLSFNKNILEKTKNLRSISQQSVADRWNRLSLQTMKTTSVVSLQEIGITIGSPEKEISVKNIFLENNIKSLINI